MNPEDIGFLVKNIDEKLRTRADYDLKCHNLTMVQSMVLSFLYDKEDNQATQKEIEEHLRISHPAVVGIVSRMEKNGHLVTWMDPHNKRNKMVRLTSRAQNLGETMNHMRQYWETVMLHGFSEEETAQLKKLLLRVNQNLQ